MFGILKKWMKSESPEPQFVIATINGRIQPLHRGEIFEDPLDVALSGLGEVTGGGSMCSKSGEIEFCDVEIQVKSTNDETINLIKSTLENIGAPKGSKLTIEGSDSVIEFGTLEGLAIYLNGTDLDEEVYANTDSNHVYSELDRLTEGVASVFSYWQGETETAFYLYGNSFSEMRSRITDLVESYPLCQKCRIEQIA